MTPARKVLIEFVLERAPAETVERRAKLYRALAADLPETAPEFRDLMRLADELERADEQHEQLLLNFRRKHGGDQ